MKLRKDNEQPQGRVRLKGRTEQRGVKTGLSFLGTFIFGGIFVAVGIGIMLIGLKVIPVDPAGVHAPYWVLTVFGLVFALAGLMIWSKAGNQFLAERRRQAALQEHPGEPALIDYGWDTSEYKPPGWKKAITSLSGAGFLTIFLSIFNYWAFFAGVVIIVKIVVIVFDIILVLVWWQFFTLLGRALKFGDSRIVFDRFPYKLSEPVAIRWMPPSGINIKFNPLPPAAAASKPLGYFTLRCVQEWFETAGYGKNSQQTMVHEEIWRERAATNRFSGNLK